MPSLKPPNSPACGCCRPVHLAAARLGMLTCTGVTSRLRNIQIAENIPSERLSLRALVALASVRCNSNPAAHSRYAYPVMPSQARKWPPSHLDAVPRHACFMPAKYVSTGCGAGLPAHCRRHRSPETRCR